MKNKSVNRYCQIILALVLLFWLQQSIAQVLVPTTTTCTVNATPVAFGIYNPNSGAPTNSNGTVIIHCSDSSAVTYTISMSQGSGGSYTPRKMSRAGGGSTLDYNIYTSSTYTNIWGDGNFGTSVITITNRRCHVFPYCQHTAYGRIPTGQLTATPGSYTDSITVTVNYN